ncbi:restriction endonuclease subunit S [Geobacter sulfurreducens subsp. ethanolicus]|uniref:restriction endonuclease subunit S n=1 Tax=Geobacter sulfurreducens TaxID=35554 RepID=UPI00257469E9|nr:restriction endonuclease subunit S [Geobacter sulfurreducens]BEH09868.1 restriction endonuclease subunit S [Geobacter sulfurreducens subsp. ethanolicus]
MVFPRYESYKPAKSKWLNEVPSHWKLLPGMAILKENKVRNIGMVEEVVLSLSYGKVIVKPPEKLTGLVPESFETYQVINPNDIIIRPTDLQNDQTSLRTGISKDRGIITSAYICLRPDPAHNPTFIHYLLHAYDLLKVYYGMGSGLRQNLDFRDFKRLELCIPPREEQDRIANFLDQKTSEIDEAIAKKQRLIELLKEQKTILINQAVTKGLNPDVPMRDSGVEWIGEVPAHWEIKKIKASLSNLDHRRIPLSSPERGKMIERIYDYYGASGVIDKVDDYIFDESLILVAEDGANLVMRNLRLAFIATGKYWVNNHAHILKPIEGDIEYLCNALECVDYNPFITGAAQPKLTKDAIKNIYLPCPPKNEQKQIAEKLSVLNQQVTDQQNLVEKEIGLLNELKQSLIASAVTGKIKI